MAKEIFKSLDGKVWRHKETGEYMIWVSKWPNNNCFVKTDRLGNVIREQRIFTVSKEMDTKLIILTGFDKLDEAKPEEQTKMEL